VPSGAVPFARLDVDEMTLARHQVSVIYTPPPAGRPQRTVLTARPGPQAPLRPTPPSRPDRGPDDAQGDPDDEADRHRVDTTCGGKHEGDGDGEPGGASIFHGAKCRTQRVCVHHGESFGKVDVDGHFHHP
jgi:hypothetical protein